jgi:hypothetical protein
MKCPIICFAPGKKKTISRTFKIRDMYIGIFMSQREREKERERKSKELLFSSPFLGKHVVRVALLFSPLAPCLAASTIVSLEW